MNTSPPEINKNKDPGASPPSIDQFFTYLAREITELKNIVKKSQIQIPPELDLGIKPGELYEQKDVATFLNTTIKVISRIPEDELPRVRRIGRGIAYYGINILCYIHRLTPIDTEAITRQMREQLLGEAPKVKPLKIQSKKQRIF